MRVSEIRVNQIRVNQGLGVVKEEGFASIKQNGSTTPAFGR